MGRSTVKSTCHPERPNCSHGLCQQCYDKARPNKEERNTQNRIRWSINKDRNHVTQKKYRMKNQEKCRWLSKQWREANPGYQRNFLMKKKYGIGVEEYNKLLQQQNGRCYICQDLSENGRDGFLHIDHDHSTGKIRGLLCSTCNAGLGMLKDHPDILMKAAFYLSRFEV